MAATEAPDPLHSDVAAAEVLDLPPLSQSFGILSTLHLSLLLILIQQTFRYLVLLTETELALLITMRKRCRDVLRQSLWKALFSPFLSSAGSAVHYLPEGAATLGG